MTRKLDPRRSSSLSIMAPTKSKYKYEDDEEPEEIEEEEQWEWTDRIIDTPPPPRCRDTRYPTQHTSVYRCGKGSFRIGDVVQLNTETSYKWVGLIRGLETDYLYKRGQQKRVIVIWFSRQQDIPVKKRRPGARAVCTSLLKEKEVQS